MKAQFQDISIIVFSGCLSFPYVLPLGYDIYNAHYINKFLILSHASSCAIYGTHFYLKFFLALCCPQYFKLLLVRYIPLLWDTFTFPQSLGILGGKPGASTYLVGVQDDKALYLDPHEVQAVRYHYTQLEPFNIYFFFLLLSCTVILEIIYLLFYKAFLIIRHIIINIITK